MTTITPMTPGPELALLRELGAIAIRIRALRAHDAGHNVTQVKALEARTRLKWDEMRALRAAPVDDAPGYLGGEGYHITDRPPAHRAAVWKS